MFKLFAVVLANLRDEPVDFGELMLYSFTLFGVSFRGCLLVFVFVFVYVFVFLLFIFMFMFMLA